MAVRQKTIEYAFPTYGTSLASATRYDFSAITVYIPETTSRTFRSVIVEVYAQDNVTTAASLTVNMVGIKLGSTAFTDTSHTVTITNTGEQCAWMFQTDVTAYFTSNFGSGASQTCQVGVSFTTPTTINHCAKLIITYDYEEQDTQIKTVRIPLESGTGALTASLVEIGTNQVPNLDTFLPETSKTYRYIWFEIEGNDSTNGTTDYTHGCALDSESRVATGTIEAGLQSSRWFRRIWVRNDMTTNATHAFKMDVSSITGGTCDHLAVTLCVTYEYSSSNSTTILNNIAIPFRVNPASTSGAASTEKDLCSIDFFIEEPVTITLVQSGIVLYYQQDAASSLAVMCGSQSARVYADSARVYCGGASLSHRIDSGSGAGAGITLARGKNTLNIYVYSNQANVKHNGLNGIAYINYTSAKSGSYGGAHNHTVQWCGHVKNANLYLIQTQAINPAIPETSYYCSQIGWWAVVNKHTTNELGGVCAMSAEWQSGELFSEGTEDLGALFGFGDIEGGVCIFNKSVIDFFQRYPGDSNSPDARLPLEVSRNWYLSTWKDVCHSRVYITYHSITYTIAGTISGTGGGTITWKVHRVDTGEIISAGTGASPSVTWYDNTINCYIEAYEDATHVGRSKNDVAV
jgi:hypothetical protein